MSEQPRRGNWRWLRHVAWVLVANITLVLVAGIVFFGSGSAHPLIRRLAIRRINAITGGQTEIRSLSIQWLSLQASVTGLVIHGKEPAGTEPLFAAEEVHAGLRIDSFWGRKVSLSDVIVRGPHVLCRITSMPGRRCLPIVVPADSTKRKSGSPLAVSGVAKAAYPHGFEHHYWRPGKLRELTELWSQHETEFFKLAKQDLAEVK